MSYDGRLFLPIQHTLVFTLNMPFVNVSSSLRYSTLEMNKGYETDGRLTI